MNYGETERMRRAVEKAKADGCVVVEADKKPTILEWGHHDWLLGLFEAHVHGSNLRKALDVKS
jgi:hypothetical protein